jgi:hypothetical protein
MFNTHLLESEGSHDTQHKNTPHNHTCSTTAFNSMRKNGTLTMAAKLGEGERSYLGGHPAAKLGEGGRELAR